MKKTWKWIIGILLVLVVIAALVAVPFAMRNYMLTNNNANYLSQARGWNNGPMMHGNEGWQQQQSPDQQDSLNERAGPMMGAGRGFNRDFRNFHGFSSFGFGFLFIGGLLRLIPLFLLGLLFYGVFQLGKRSGMRSNQASAPVSMLPASPAVTTAENNEIPAS